MKAEMMEIAKEVLIALGVMKFVHPGKGAETTGASAAGAKKEDDGKTAKVRFGGFFDSSDEEGYAGLIGQMSRAKALKVATFLNTFPPLQRQRFRGIVANLSRVTGEKPAPPPSDKAAAGAQPATTPPAARTSKKPSPSLGLKFMNCLADCADDNERMAICQSAGVTESLIDNVSDAIAHVSGQAGRAAKAIEQSPVAQTVMTGLAGLMQKRIDHLHSKP